MALAARFHVDRGRRRSCRRASQLEQAREHLLGGGRGRDHLGDVGEHRVRVRTAAEHKAVGKRLDPQTYRLKAIATTAVASTLSSRFAWVAAPINVPTPTTRRT